MRHIDLCGLMDIATTALSRRDYVAADRARNRAYCSDELLAWFVGEQIGILMAQARDEDRRPTVEDLRSVA